MGKIFAVLVIALFLAAPLIVLRMLSTHSTLAFESAPNAV
jgi:hypothetical protein